MSMSKREKTLVSFVLILALVCAYYIFFLKPHLEEMNSLLVDQSSKEMLVLTYNEQASRLNQINDEISQNEALVASYGDLISQGHDQPPMLVYLEETVNAHAEKVMFAFNDIKTYGQLEAIPVTATMICSYDGLKALLSALSENEYFIKVTQLNVDYSSIFEPVDQDATDDGTGGDTTADTAADAAANTEETSGLVVVGYNLNVKMEFEVYNLAGDIPPDTEYTFDDDFTEFGGDIFE